MNIVQSVFDPFVKSFGKFGGNLVITAKGRILVGLCAGTIDDGFQENPKFFLILV